MGLLDGIITADDPTINARNRSRSWNRANTRNQNTNRQQEINGPLPQLAGNYGQLWDMGGQAVTQVNNNPFGGNFVAQASPMETAALARGRDILGSGVIGRGAEDYVNLLGSTIRGDYLRPESNPFLAGAIDLAQRSTMENFNNSVMPAISDRSIAQGAYGGARQDIQQNLAAQDAQRGMGDIAANLTFANYGAERARQLAAGSMLGGAYDLTMAPVTTGMSLGGAERQMGQLAIDNELARFGEQMAAPWRGLPEYAQVLGAGGFGANRGIARGNTRGQTSGMSRTRGTSETENPNADSAFQNFLETGLGIGSTVATMGGTNGFKWW